MRDLIPSRDVAKYLQSRAHQFTDFEQATLIYNTDWSMGEKQAALMELADRTSDEKLADQINARIARDKECMRRIQDKQGNYLFKLEVWEKEDHEYEEAGYFTAYQMAKSCADKCRQEYRIIKAALLETEQEWDEQKCGNIEVAYVYYNSQGEAMEYWLSDEESKLMDNRAGFEDAYLPIPYPFCLGDIVRVIDTDEIGIVRGFATTCEQEKYFQRLQQRENILPCDYSDTFIAVEILCEGAVFGHQHISPLKLEYAHLKDDDDRKELMESASWLVRGEGYIQAFQMACEKYKKQIKKEA